MSANQDVRTEIAGRYRLGSEIGRGGMGTVWHAEDTLLKRGVAVKEIALPAAVGAEERESIRKRVLREARAAAALNHPNAVTVFDVVEEDGKAFIVMECIDGETLEDLVKNKGPLPDEDLMRITRDVLAALEVAHAAGIVHRDVKPANVMITRDGRTKLADFGIATVKDDPKITASGLVLGSPSFMSPEQATHGDSGPPADLWGLGATLYFALEGVPPFDRPGPIPTLTAVVGDDPRPMQRSGPATPIVAALLKKDPAERATAADVRGMMREDAAVAATPSVDDHPSTTVRLDSTPPPTRPVTEARSEPAPVAASERDGEDHRPWAWLVGLASVILIAVLVAMFFAGRDDGNVAGDPEPKKKDKNVAAAKGDDEADKEKGSKKNEQVAEDTAAVPADWTTYEDPATGYTISHPDDWTVKVRDEKNTIFSSGDGSFLQVGWRSPPDEAGAVGAWEEYEPSFAERQDDYERITIESYDFKGMEAGWWEMTYEGLHAVNLGFITPDEEYGMALFFNTPEDEWEASQPLFEQFRASFQVPE